jgi:hypothetical protein
MTKDALLKKYGSKIKIVKEPGLLRESDFQEIVITDEFSAKKNNTIISNATIRKKNKEGEFEETFDSKQYQICLVMENVRFDGRKLTRAEAERLESRFLLELFTIAVDSETPEELSEISEEKPDNY